MLEIEQIKRVILHNSYRNGYYYRYKVNDKGKIYYRYLHATGEMRYKRNAIDEGSKRYTKKQEKYKSVLLSKTYEPLKNKGSGSYVEFKLQIPFKNYSDTQDIEQYFLYYDVDDIDFNSELIEFLKHFRNQVTIKYNVEFNNDIERYEYKRIEYGNYKFFESKTKL